MNEHQQIEQLAAVYGDLNAAERRRVERHTQDCASCAARLADYEAMDRTLAALPSPQPNARLSKSFYAALDKKRTRPTRRRVLQFSFAASLCTLALVTIFFWVLDSYISPVFRSNQLALSGESRRMSRLAPSVPDTGGGGQTVGTSDGYLSSSFGRRGDSSGGTSTVNDAPYDLTFYENYGVNPIIDTEDDHFSTFAIDVDTASYTLMRRYLRDGNLPDKDSVRVEEYVNYFRQDYAPPAQGQAAFAIHLEGAPAPFGGENYSLLRVGLQGYSVPDEQRKDAALVFVIDVSGSMSAENRLGAVKHALRMLVQELRPSDSVGIVVYGSQGRVILEPTSVEQSDVILAAIERLQPGGSTNAQEGLLLGYQMAAKYYKAGGINRVILCSDGVANVGNTGPKSILEQIHEYAQQGISLSTVGFGMGNYNDVLMEQLADDGDGNYAYVDTLEQARRVFVQNLTGMLQTIALDTKIQLEFNPQVVGRYRLLGYENRDVADEDFSNDEVDAGEVGAGHSVTALYEIKFHPEAQGQALTVYARYQDPDTDEVVELSHSFARSDLLRLEETTPRFRLDAAVAEFAEILRHSYWAKDASLEAVLSLASQAAQELPNDPDVAEFVSLAAQVDELWQE